MPLNCKFTSCLQPQADSLILLCWWENKLPVCHFQGIEPIISTSIGECKSVASAVAAFCGCMHADTSAKNSLQLYFFMGQWLVKWFLTSGSY